MFDNSLTLLEACDVVFGHIFPFSPRAGTPAARMPQLDHAEIKVRAERLRAATLARKSTWLDTLIGTTQSVLIELDGMSGHAENFARVKLVQLTPAGNMRGAIVKTRITGRDGETLTGIAL
jgi:threonylcarbamoyladenosine tRNA methylthiotransferase MtaB